MNTKTDKQIPQAKTGASRQGIEQRGASLVVTLLMLVVVMLLGAAAAQMALQGEKASRGDRDRQVAFQAAEAALMDAELDIENSVRSSIFKDTGVEKFRFIAGCGAGASGNSWGLCLPSASGQTAVWLKVDFTEADAADSKSVPFGSFTGQAMQVGVGSTPVRLPRYIIEIFSDTKKGSKVGEVNFYRITAIGFGMRNTTRVVLQTFYRKIE